MYEQSLMIIYGAMNEPHPNKWQPRCYAKSPKHRMCFGQYQSSSAVQGCMTTKWELLSNAKKWSQVTDVTYKTGRSCSNI